MQISSAAFEDGAAIPPRHTCDGKDLSPELRWADFPPETRSFALIVDDPDAPGRTWVHWLLYNLPATVTALAEDQPRTQYLPNRGCQGLNDFRRLGYGGPCPPPGPPHRYVFTLHALDCELGLKPGLTRPELDRALQGHVLASAQLVGLYAR